MFAILHFLHNEQQKSTNRIEIKIKQMSKNLWQLVNEWCAHASIEKMVSHCIILRGTRTNRKPIFFSLLINAWHKT